MTPWFHVRHVLLMPATCDCAWLLTMPIVATMRGHRSLGLLDCSHYDPFEPCAPGEFRVFESVGCLQLFAFCLHCCNVLQHLSKFVAVIAVTARLKFVWQGRVYIWCCLYCMLCGGWRLSPCRLTGTGAVESRFCCCWLVASCHRNSFLLLFAAARCCCWFAAQVHLTSAGARIVVY